MADVSNGLFNAQTVQTFEGISVEQMYREHILDHYKNPRNRGLLENSLHQHENNPLCGDEVDIYMKIENNKVINISFESKGCAISQASASMLSEHIKNKYVEHVTTISQEGMKELLGIDVTAMRAKCMMLPLKAVKMIIYKHLGRVEGVKYGRA